MIPIFTIIIVIFLAILTFQTRKTTNAQEEVEEKFWAREREANATRRKDISNLDYITIPDGLFPLNLDSAVENQLAGLIGKKMLNLTGMTNTDLKLEYGVQNLDELTSYDDNFAEFIRLSPDYAKELIAAGQTNDARNILEFAVNNLADSCSIFDILSSIYVEAGETSKISQLISLAEKLDSLSKNIILDDINKKLQ